ncbi:MAG: glycosyltransferase [Proteobacteria bacterium]|nr:glycosyltransferase [Pseudomonadota bacterium]
MSPDTLNLFYEEPDPDRWFPFDRYPRRLIRLCVRGRSEPRGTLRAFMNLVEGLDRIGVPYRINDYRWLRAHRDELACVFGKPHVLDKIPDETPILFGTSIYSHPSDNPQLPRLRKLKQVLVPSAWVQAMFEEVWPGLVTVWPVGIDTERWQTPATAVRDVDVLIYDKIYWRRAYYEKTLLEPLHAELARRGLRVETLRYGLYREEQLHALSRCARSMVYLSRHETQGIAAQQMLAAGVPLFAWDEGGLWQDPQYFPHAVNFGPVTSVPYWDDRCGARFRDGSDVVASFDGFWRKVEADVFKPREMIVENLTLEKCATAYVELTKRFG